MGKTGKNPKKYPQKIKPGRFLTENPTPEPASEQSPLNPNQRKICAPCLWLMELAICAFDVMMT